MMSSTPAESESPQQHSPHALPVTQFDDPVSALVTERSEVSQPQSYYSIPDTLTGGNNTERSGSTPVIISPLVSLPEGSTVVISIVVC